MDLMLDIIGKLGLKKPVDLTLKNRKAKDWDAFYQPIYSDKNGTLKSHRIVIYIADPQRDFATLLAHELIHAWQEEHYKQEMHGRWFQEKAEELQEEFGIENIFLEEFDYE